MKLLYFLRACVKYFQQWNSTDPLSFERRASNTDREQHNILLLLLLLLFFIFNESNEITIDMTLCSSFLGFEWRTYYTTTYNYCFIELTQCKILPCVDLGTLAKYYHVFCNHSLVINSRILCHDSVSERLWGFYTKSVLNYFGPQSP